MIEQPVIKVGILGAEDGSYTLHGRFVSEVLPDGSRLFTPEQPEAFFTLPAVKIGIGFHWQRRMPQSFRGALMITPDNLIINVITLEEYLASVISSEMNADAPAEFLKAHAIVSRSWLVAMLRREQTGADAPATGCHALLRHDPELGCREIVRWYDREAHNRFDVCADDHCQRYQGIARTASPRVFDAIKTTRGMVLATADGEVCDARFSKCCGGVTEEFAAAWEDVDVPYLHSVSDIAPDGHIYCATTDRALLSSVLNDYDLASPSIFHWQESVGQQLLRQLLAEKVGVDAGYILALEPLSRGKSGRITRLLIRGTRESIVVGKELEIRRLLSSTHLKSSAFTVTAEGVLVTPEGERVPERFVIDGRGWGHGVGMCQIGAAAMAAEGHTCESILNHYFTDADITRIYN